jgi:hypothetical protein
MMSIFSTVDVVLCWLLMPLFHRLRITVVCSAITHSTFIYHADDTEGSMSTAAQAPVTKTAIIISFKGIVIDPAVHRRSYEELDLAWNCIRVCWLS